MRFFLLTALAAVLAGCAATPEFKSLASRSAEIEWRLGETFGRLRADFYTATSGSVRIVARAEGATLELTQFPEIWTATGSLARGGWRGVPDTAPPHLAGWVALALAYGESKNLPEGVTEYRTVRYSVRYTVAGGTLVAMELAAADTGDRFRVTFASR